MNYKIGPFRRLTGLTEGTLRYYEKLGLLKPSRNGDNDYRY
jgi:DNA-binding transcriptional MerR regulator